MQKHREYGFSYIEIMVAVTIMLVGIIALLSAITGSVVRSREHEQQLMARRYAASTIEAIISVRDINKGGRLGWAAMANKGVQGLDGSNQGIFLTGDQPIYETAGADGIVGTSDDSTNGKPVPNFRRKIVITDVCDPDRPSAGCPQSPDSTSNNPIHIRNIEVSVQYRVASGWRTERVSTTVSDYRTQY
jgi:type II secretory pathway pseudopilin PulG